MGLWSFVIIDKGVPRPRNDSLFDIWSLVHLFAGIAAAWVVHPVFAWTIMALWEPLEIFVISPLVYKFTRIEFGYETWRNSLSDLVFNTVGIMVGYWAVRGIFEPPFIFP